MFWRKNYLISYIFGGKNCENDVLKNEKVSDTKENIVKNIGDKVTWCELWVCLMRIDQTNVVVPQLSHTLTYMNEFQIEN